jgi:hypothetical protein
MKNKIIVFKLSSGDEIMGKIEKDTDYEYVLVNPLSVSSTVTESGVLVIYLKSYINLSDNNKVSLNKSHVTASYVPQKEFITYYEKMVQYTRDIIEKDTVAGLTAATQIINVILKKKEKGITTSLTEEVDDYLDNMLDDLPTQQPLSKKKIH